MEYKLIELEDKPIFDEFFTKYPPKLCQYSFATFYSWNQGFFNYFYKIENNRLIIKAKDAYGEDVCIFKPIGEIHTAEELYEIILQEKVKTMTMFCEDCIKKLSEENLSKYFSLEFEPHHSDYYYLSYDLAELKGRKLSGKRNLVKQFKEAYFENGITTLPIHDLTKEDFENLIEQWCGQKNFNGDDPELMREIEALRRTLAHKDILKTDGLAIKIGNDLAGISVFEELNPETAVIHYEKCKNQYKGIYQFINQEAAKTLSLKYKYINRESDEGIDGLRHAKMSYQPINLEKAYLLTLK
jgi:hypothetical protein